MSLIQISNHLSKYEYFRSEYWFIKSGDARITERPLFSGGPWLVCTIIAAYLIFAMKIGPELMKNRKPLQLRGTLLLYNVTMVAINSYFFIESLICYNFGRDLLNFGFPNDSNSPAEMRKVDFVYFYTISKLVDLMDTVFFVLRKKQNQITPLHLYHHSSVPFCVWMAVYSFPTAGPSGVFPILNSLVHVIMYSYYALAALGPAVQRYLWWKRYITQIQLVQFVIFAIYATTFFILESGYPKILVVVALFQPPLYLFLFGTFYKKCYHLEAPQKSQ